MMRVRCTRARLLPLAATLVACERELSIDVEGTGGSSSAASGASNASPSPAAGRPSNAGANAGGSPSSPAAPSASAPTPSEPAAPAPAGGAPGGAEPEPTDPPSPEDPPPADPDPGASGPPPQEPPSGLEGIGDELEGAELLVSDLTSIELPAVGDTGVSLLAYSDPQNAFVLFVDWKLNVASWYQNQTAYFAYTAAHGASHAALLYLNAGYAVYSDGGVTELSAARNEYKEFLAANQDGLAWVNFGSRAQGGQNASAELGEVVFQTHSGERSVLTDSLRYRARLDLSETHLACVEYADTEGAVGQVVVVPLAGGEPIAVAPSEHHQDRPAIDGDWVVWEEYVSDTDAVIRARNLTTAELVDLSSSTGFRTNPDIRGTRVVWEDQISGDGDIHFADIGTGTPARAIVQMPGHSTGARSSADALVWLQVNAGKIGLWRARYRP